MTSSKHSIHKSSERRSNNRTNNNLNNHQNYKDNHNNKHPSSNNNQHPSSNNNKHPSTNKNQNPSSNNNKHPSSNNHPSLLMLFVLLVLCDSQLSRMILLHLRISVLTRLRMFQHGWPIFAFIFSNLIELSFYFMKYVK